MTGLADAVGDVASAATGQLWKFATVVLAVLLLGTAGGLSFEWWLAAHDRDVARAALVVEQGVSAQLRAGIDTQNIAILAQAKLAREAEARGLVAQQQAAVAGRRFDGALQQLTGAWATTCADAMPAVNRLLEQVR